MRFGVRRPGWPQRLMTVRKPLNAWASEITDLDLKCLFQVKPSKAIRTGENRKVKMSKMWSAVMMLYSSVEDVAEQQSTVPIALCTDRAEESCRSMYSCSEKMEKTVYRFCVFFFSTNGLFSASFFFKYSWLPGQWNQSRTAWFYHGICLDSIWFIVWRLPWSLELERTTWQVQPILAFSPDSLVECSSPTSKQPKV